jgi:hypothetical protein
MSLGKSIFTTYLHVGDGAKTVHVPASDSFWQELMNGSYPQLDRGRLMSAFTFSEPWSTWERHPAGEELVMLLSGSVELLLEEVDGVRAAQLTEPGEYVLVPRGVWHTARTSAPTSMLFLTPGEGTEHKSVDA